MISSTTAIKGIFKNKLNENYSGSGLWELFKAT
jgi:hypothetical protein